MTALQMLFTSTAIQIMTLQMNGKELSIIARKENPLGDKDLSMLLYDLLCDFA